MLELTGTTALVTGGASGMGAAVTEALHREGVTVASLDVQPGGRAKIKLDCDVSDEASVRSSVDAAVAELGRLDYAFVNAGVSGGGGVIEMPMAEWDRVIAVNLRGAFMTLQACAQKMRDAGSGGAIALTASTAAMTTEIAIANYSVAKVGVAMLARVAARELGLYGIRVNAVAPGLTRTGMTAGSERIPGYHEHTNAITPLGRLGEPEDVAEAVLALFALRWVTGQVLAVDGGLSLVSPHDIPGVTPETVARGFDFGTLIPTAP
jgi:NAD(P)-dependent dehydrogenase (short-subunit alcohol dehydrogenase family)